MKPIAVFWLLVGMLLSGVQVSWAQAQAEGEKTSTLADISAYASPQATVETFLKAMMEVKRGHTRAISRAVAALDLSQVNPLVRNEKGQDYAWMLYEVLSRKKISPRRISRFWKPDRYPLLKFRRGQIALERQEDGRWLFSSDTLTVLPNILDQLLQDSSQSFGNGDLPWYMQLRTQLPESLKHKALRLEYWQWLGILLFTVLGFVIDKICRWLLQVLMRRWLHRGLFDPRLELGADWLRPLGLLTMAAVWWLGLNILGLPDQALAFLLVPVKVLAGLAGVWAAYRLIDVLCAWFAVRAAKTASRLDDALVPLLRKSLKVFATIVGLMFVAANLNVNLAGLIAGLGLGGLAFALAAKDLVQNLFGSITILLDQGFHVGDWVVIDDIEGMVEEIGLRSTRIRTFYDSLVILPNSRLITASIDNMGQRRYRRMKCMLGLTYDTPPEKIDAFCEGIRELVRQHPYTRKDYFHVYFHTMGASSLDILVYVFWEAPNWGTELRERQRFLLDILRLARRMGIEFAYPTQTLYLKTGQGEIHMDGTPILQQAQESAKAVVAETTGLGVKPPPVAF